MLFRRKKSGAGAGGWREFARRLELDEAPDSRAELCDLLDLEPDTAFPALYARDLGAGETLFFFAFQGARPPSGSGPRLDSGCMLRTGRLLPVSLRASARLHPVLESLGASATGGQRLRLPGREAFDEKLTVYAREPEAALRLLTPVVCEALLRALAERGATPTLLMGGRHLLLLCRASAQATSLETLEALSSDLLGIYAGLSAAGLGREAGE